MPEKTYMRKLPYAVIHELGLKLNPGDRWKDLAVYVCMPPEFVKPRYTESDLWHIEQVKYRPGGSCTEEMLRDWGTLNCTVGDLVHALVQARLYIASDYLCRDVLKKTSMPRLPGDEETEEFVLMDRRDSPRYNSPVESVDPHPDDDIHPTSTTKDTKTVGSPSSQGTQYTVYPYQEILRITGNFDERKKQDGGHLIGKGGFGTVYYGRLPSEEVAIKRLKENPSVQKQFTTEIKTMLRFQNENILRIKGFSTDGPFFCIIYEYMVNGSLEDRLGKQNNYAILSVPQRISIAKDTARGITYLHTAFDPPLVHRDIKSANVLLDQNMQAKIADFGFARQGAHGNSSTVVVTQVAIGTGAYMAPEAVQSSDVSTKLDTFSYGVILLELLTSLPPYDENREERNLWSHIEESPDEIDEFLDKEAGIWPTQLVQDMHDLAMRCLTLRKAHRPIMREILPTIEKLTVM